jgi:hypothetical protein
MSARLEVGLDGQPCSIFLCECGQYTLITFTGLDRNVSEQQVAYTCEECDTSHWFWVETSWVEVDSPGTSP